MKYKQMYLDEKKRGDRLDYEVGCLRDDKTELKAKIEGIDMLLSKIEGRESHVLNENEWLKTTLRLVIVDGEKVKMLADELETDNMRMNTKKF